MALCPRLLSSRPVSSRHVTSRRFSSRLLPRPAMFMMCCAMEPAAVLYGTVQYSTVQYSAARLRVAHLPGTVCRPASSSLRGSVKSPGSRQEPQNSRFMQADHGMPRCLTRAKPTNLREWMVTTHQTAEATSSPTVSATLERCGRAGVVSKRAPSILRAVWCETHQQTGPRSRSAFSVWLPTATGDDAIISTSSVLPVALDIVGSTGTGQTGPSTGQRRRDACGPPTCILCHATAQGSEITRTGQDRAGH